MSQLAPSVLLLVVAAYFLLLLLTSYFTGRKADNLDFFVAGRKAKWYLVAFGMIGTSLSGVTFVSIPGVVGGDGLNKCFSYLQLTMGYLCGYFFIATVLLPLYYRLNLTSIYGFLEGRFGFFSYKTGAVFFILSRLIGSSFRLYLMAVILHQFVLVNFGIPFWLTVLITLALILMYTYRGGIKTIVITDTFQTIAMLGAVLLTILAIGNELGKSPMELVSMIQKSEYSRVFFFDGGWNDPNNFFKQFIGGALITTVMTGLDQDMMQKNLSCRNLKEAQKNMFTFSIILFFVILMFISLGALLYLYAGQTGIPIPPKTDFLYPTIAIQHISAYTAIIFVLGLIAAGYSSADGTLTALTTSVCVDFLSFEKRTDEAKKKRTRVIVHSIFTALTFIVVMIFYAWSNESVINELLKIAGYTYGPLLGLFAFGIVMKNYRVQDKWVPFICVAAPILTILIDNNSASLFNGFQFGFLNYAVNGFLTFLGLWAVSYKT